MCSGETGGPGLHAIPCRYCTVLLSPPLHLSLPWQQTEVGTDAATPVHCTESRLVQAGQQAGIISWQEGGARGKKLS